MEEQEKIDMEYVDILSRRQKHIKQYCAYFLKLDLQEHIAQLRVQKANKKNKAKSSNRKNLIMQMQELCSILYKDYQEIFKEAEKRNVEAEDLVDEDQYYYALANKFYLAKIILKELKQKESKNKDEYPYYYEEDSYLSEADKEFYKKIDDLFTKD